MFGQSVTLYSLRPNHPQQKTKSDEAKTKVTPSKRRSLRLVNQASTSRMSAFFEQKVKAPVVKLLKSGGALAPLSAHYLRLYPPVSDAI